ncbi:MAG: protein-L-isoaspartate O-methyltransferase [Pseudomonadota bacterium]|nr:protein-L-isoaspartate O-methyltransferase [Pseudomonadota bacterium]
MTLDFAAARENMVENQVRTNDVTDLAIQDAMREVRRERVCPPTKLHLAYAEATVEYAPGYFLMEPRDIAKLLQGIKPKAGERALAIAAPYAAAVLAAMGLSVTLRLPEGAESIDAGDGVTVSIGDLAAAIESGPYDVIVVEGAVHRAPAAWTDLLAEGGRLGVVERDGPVGRARLYQRGIDGVVSVRPLFDSTPHVLPGFGPVAAFAF